MITEEKLESLTGFIRGLDTSSSGVVTGNIKDFGEQKSLEDRISREIGGNVGVSVNKENKFKERALTECEKEWVDKKNYYLDINNNVEKVDLGLKTNNQDFSTFEKELASQFFALSQYNMLAERKQLIKDVVEINGSVTYSVEKEGKNFERYGFDKDSVFNAVMHNSSMSDDKKIEVPRPKLKKMSFMDKVKKRFTGKSEVEEYNKKIQKQYDEFTGKVEKLFSGIDLGYISRSINQISDLEKVGDSIEDLRAYSAIDFNKRLKDYLEAKRYEAVKNSVVRDFNEQHKDEFAEVKGIRQERIEEAKLAKATAVVDKISDGQFRDVDVAKDDAGKKKETEERYEARKYLKDRGLLQSKLEQLRGLGQLSSKPVVKREMSKDMVRQVSQGGRQ